MEFVNSQTVGNRLMFSKVLKNTISEVLGLNTTQPVHKVNFYVICSHRSKYRIEPEYKLV